VAPIVLSAERWIAAPAERVYRLVADYARHHHRFLPPAFVDYRVEEGGYGAGTVLSFGIRSLGQVRRYRTTVAEPDPGRVLSEHDPASDTLTTFTVSPEGEGSRARIETRWQPAGGLAGWLERLLAPLVAGRLYADELERLDRYARSNPPD
jgi:hypothetical protein